VSHHLQVFGHTPNLVAAYRGIHASESEGRLVAIPTVGKGSAVHCRFAAIATMETGVSLACRHRGPDGELEAGPCGVEVPIMC
jgi:hypothetical protein